MSRQLKGRVAFVTGAGRGIGRGIACVLAARGAVVVVADIDGVGAKETVGEIGSAGGKALSLTADVASQDSLDAAAVRALTEFGRVDICVANAGVYGAPGVERRQEYTEDDWDATFEVNVKGLVHTADAFIPYMKGCRSGRIITIASHSGRAPRGVKSRPTTVGMPYQTSKAAAIQYTHALAIELAPFNVTVNCVCPGTLWTPMWEKIATNAAAYDGSLAGVSPREVFERQIARQTPLGRPQTPEDIGRAVAFFASDDASEVTGQALNVNGGAILS